VGGGNIAGGARAWASGGDGGVPGDAGRRRQGSWRLRARSSSRRCSRHASSIASRAWRAPLLLGQHCDPDGRRLSIIRERLGRPTTAVVEQRIRGGELNALPLGVF